MFIERIDIERFGALSDVSIEGLGPGIEVLHGTNETGKTSLLEFVRGVFFGFGGLFRRGVLDPHTPCGGSLLAQTGVDMRRILIERRHEGPHLQRLSRTDYAAEKDLPVADHLTVTDAQEPAGSSLFLRDYMGDIDEGTFTAVMAFGLDELHELQTLDAEGCGSRLYELASGLDRSKVTTVLDNIRSSLARLDSADPEISPLEALRQKRSAVLSRMAAMQAPAIAAGSLGTELARIDAEIAEQTAHHSLAQHAEELLRSTLPLEPLFHAKKRAAERVAALEATPLIHADLDTWQLASKRRDSLAREAAKLKKTRSLRARDMKAHAPDALIWKKRAAVMALGEEQPRLDRLAAEAARATLAAKQAARRFGEQMGTAGLVRLVALDRPASSSPDALAEMLLPSGLTRSFTSLKARAREVAVAGREVKEVLQQVAEAKAAVAGTRSALKATPAGGTTIAAAIEEASGRATLLRNRITAGEQLAELDRSLGRLEKEMATHLEGQLIPVEWLLGLGAMFVLGSALLLSGLFLPAAVTGSLAYAMAALGLAGTGVASVTTWSLDRAASSRLEGARQQLLMVRKQRDESVSQCGLIDKKIEAGRGPVERYPGEHAAALDRRAAAAQAEVERLEAVAAREGSLHVLADRVTAAEQELSRATARRVAARGRWKQALEQRSLPTTLTPADIKQLSRHRHTLLALDEERQRASEEARLRTEELAAFGHRIEQLMVECDMLPDGTPQEHLQQLRERLDRESTGHRLRGTLASRLEKARQRHREALRRVKLADQRVREIIARWNVETEKEFLALVDRRPLVEEARLEAQGAEQAWLEARRRIDGLPELERWLGEARLVTLEQRLAEARVATLQTREAIDRIRSLRQAAAAKVESAAKDHSTEGIQMELAAVEQELEHHLHRRRLLAEAATLLEETRGKFAREHQPAVLREASRWLVRLTGGHYTRITTSIHEARLEVHDGAGHLWNPDRLSRGTREQVFLALRLALVQDLERHGVHLPLVMDDALVNFDDSRAQAAAEVLLEFVADQPRQRQLLVLTCHAHVARIFAESGASVRSLSEPGTSWMRRAAPTVTIAEPATVVVPRLPVAPPPEPAIASGPVRVIVRQLPAESGVAERVAPAARGDNPWVPRGRFASRPPQATPPAASRHHPPAQSAPRQAPKPVRPAPVDEADKTVQKPKRPRGPKAS